MTKNEVYEELKNIDNIKKPFAKKALDSMIDEGIIKIEKGTGNTSFCSLTELDQSLLLDVPPANSYEPENPNPHSDNLKDEEKLLKS